MATVSVYDKTTKDHWITVATEVSERDAWAIRAHYIEELRGIDLEVDQTRDRRAQAEPRYFVYVNRDLDLNGPIKALVGGHHDKHDRLLRYLQTGWLDDELKVLHSAHRGSDFGQEVWPDLGTNEYNLAELEMLQQCLQDILETKHRLQDTFPKWAKEAMAEDVSFLASLIGRGSWFNRYIQPLYNPGAKAWGRVKSGLFYQQEYQKRMFGRIFTMAENEDLGYLAWLAAQMEPEEQRLHLAIPMAGRDTHGSWLSIRCAMAGAIDPEFSDSHTYILMRCLPPTDDYPNLCSCGCGEWAGTQVDPLDEPMVRILFNRHVNRRWIYLPEEDDLYVSDVDLAVEERPDIES
jgi:hypothetical protein